MHVLRINGVQHYVGPEQDIRNTLAEKIREARKDGADIEPNQDESSFQFTKVTISLPGCIEPDVLEVGSEYDFDYETDTPHTVDWDQEQEVRNGVHTA